MAKSGVNALARAQIIANALGDLPGVVAVALAGSLTAHTADAHSDLDIYVYCTEVPPRADREVLAHTFAGEGDPSIELDKPYWGPEDAWIDRASGLGIDLVYWSPEWITDQIERTLVRHEAWGGYTTAFWYTVLRSQPLVDPTGWFAELQQRADQPYPEPLRRAILRMNYPVLRQSRSAYLHQLELAVARRDRVSVNHRITALLASYFDIVFAVNQQPQPGEKRLIARAEQMCTRLPENMVQDIDALLCSGGASWETMPALDCANTLLDRLDALLIAEELLTLEGQLVP